MSDAPDCEQPPEEIADKTETIPIVELEPKSDLPLPPPPEDEWIPIPNTTNVNASFSRCLHATTPVILGVLSLLLLGLCGFFGYQYVQASESMMQSLNQWIQNNEEKFLQIQNVVDQNKETLEGLQTQNMLLMDILQELRWKEANRPGPSVNHWIQHRDHCYNQTTETVSWFQCPYLCSTVNATFLKTERSTLMNIMPLLSVSHAWLGLSYKQEANEWKWEDGSTASPDLFLRGLPEPSVEYQWKCAYLKADTIGADDCNTTSSCICEKEIC